MPTKSGRLSLFEVTVVLFCIGVVVSLLLPGLDVSISDSRRHACTTQIRSLAQASIMYESAKLEYPGYCNDFGTFQRGADPTNPKRVRPIRSHRKIGTWAVTLLPYLDQQALYETWVQDRYPIAFSEPDEYGASSGVGGKGFSGLVAYTVPPFHCPDDERDIRGNNSYAANTGMHPAVGIADFAQSMSAANGVLNNKFAGLDFNGNVVPVGQPVSAKDLKDGLSLTLLFSENLNAIPWHRAGLIDASHLIPAKGQSEILYPITSRYSQGLVWHYEDPMKSRGAEAVKQVHRINGLPKNGELKIGDLVVTPANAADLARPSSNHHNGVNVSFADGTTRFITQTIDYRVYQAMLTPHGRASDVPQTDFVLRELE